MVKPLFLSCALILGLLFSPLSLAEQQTEAEQDYVVVMHGLVENMQSIVVAIMYEDYETMADLAENIAYHPGPSSDKRLTLLRKLGMEALTFRMYEDTIRQHALQLMGFAQKSDQVNVLKTYADLAQACTDCHNSYRAQIRGFKRQEFSPSLFKR